MGFFSSLFGQRNPPAADPGSIEMDSKRIAYVRQGQREEMLWADLIEVTVITTDEGPLTEDLYFMLLGPTLEKGLGIPQGAKGNETLVQRLQRLKGFNNGVLIEAMGSTRNARFVCWKKSGTVKGVGAG